ncbi:glycosyltransferase family 25 protein [Candidatus Pelagibacter communis]|uniref:glycosyltransferase family 25 protein n=1 Tax=Pelagibacter ubique TaxID=198252 RepID=UPI00094C5815|nr:glycosyltransferase family 25 protein [Candidatus Pelagibacter ubique]
MSEIKIFVISLKESNRTPKIIKRLKQLKIKFEIFYGINGHKKKNFSKLLKVYDEKKTENYIGRQLAFPEIAASLSHINIYKMIIRRRIKSAIIIEDDAYPSKILFKWIKMNTKIIDNSILSFYSYPSGYLGKVGKKTRVEKVKIHTAVTHINNSSCYQINLKTCKKIIKITKGKICGVGDWPFNYKKDNIILSSTLPYLTIIDDAFDSSTAPAREKFLKQNKLINFFNKSILFIIIKNLIYLSCIPFVLKKKMHFDFYKEQFFEKSFFFFKNIFLKNNISTYTIFKDKNYYYDDLRLHRFFKKK